MFPNYAEVRFNSTSRTRKYTKIYLKIPTAERLTRLISHTFALANETDLVSKGRNPSDVGMTLFSFIVKLVPWKKRLISIVSSYMLV